MSMRSIVLSGILSVVMTCALAAPAALSAEGADQAPCAAEWIEGTVTDSHGAGLAAVPVSIWTKAQGQVGSDVTDGSGAFLICADPGEYAVVFNANGGNDYLSEVYNNKKFGCGDTVTVQSGLSTAVTAVLSMGAILTGTVTDGTTPLSGVRVSAFGGKGGAGATTDALGVYRIGGLRSGDYYVRFDNGAEGYEYYNDRGFVDEAERVTVTEGAVTTIDAALSPFGSISGTVDDGTLPLQGAFVEVTNDRMGPRSDVTDAAGNFTVAGLRDGSYSVLVDPPGDRMQWYSGKVSRETADTVEITGGNDVTGIDVTVHPGGSISGVVSGGGAGLGGVSISLVDDRGIPLMSGVTAGDGSYTFNGLFDGSYRVYAAGWGGGRENEWYGGAADPADAAKIVVAGASDASGADIDLAAVTTGTMSGTMSYEGGSCGLEFDANIIVFPASSPSEFIDIEQFASPTAAWQSPPLPPGDYRVLLGNPGGGHAVRWYPGVPSLNRSRTVTVSAGADRPGVDVLLPRSGRMPEPAIFVNTPSYMEDVPFTELLTMVPGERHPLGISLTCNDALGVPADWWLLAYTPLPPPRDVYHYEPGSGWVEGLEASRQGPCRDVTRLVVTDLPFVPVAGPVDIYFGLDGDMNGLLDPGVIFYGGLRVHMDR